MPERSAPPTKPPTPRTVPSGNGRPHPSSNGSSNGSSSPASNGASRPAPAVDDDTAIRTSETPVMPPPPPVAPAEKSRDDAKKAREEAKKAKVEARAAKKRDRDAAKRDGESDPALDPTATASRPRSTRRARLRLTRVDPWSVMKTAFLLSIAFGVVTVVSVAMVWQVLGAAGVWDSINATIQETIGGPDTSSFDVQDYVGTSRVLGFTMLVAAVDVVLLTAVATLGAFLYNMAAALLGGIEVTLAEDPH